MNKRKEKMMLRILQSMTILALFSVIFGCEDSGTDPDPTVLTGSASVTLDIQGTRPAALLKSAVVDTVAIEVGDVNNVIVGTLLLTDALISLKEIELKSEKEQEDEAEGIEDNELEFPGPYVVDLIANTVSPSLDTVVIDTGIYTQIELKMDKIEGDEEDDDGTQLVNPNDPLFGNSIYVRGSYSGTTAGGEVTGVPFLMLFELEEDFTLSTVDSTTGIADSSLGFNVNEGEVNPIIIAFRLQTWFQFDNPQTNSDGFDFTDLVVTQDSLGADIIELSSEVEDGDNDKIHKVVKENIKKSADYGEDEDGDGELGDDEDDDEDDGP